MKRFIDWIMRFVRKPKTRSARADDTLATSIFDLNKAIDDCNR